MTKHIYDKMIFKYAVLHRLTNITRYDHKNIEVNYFPQNRNGTHMSSAKTQYIIKEIYNTIQ